MKQEGVITTVDVTFTHPGAHMLKLNALEALKDPNAVGTYAARVKVNKYRHITTDASGKGSKDPIAFVPLPLSITGRPHPITERFLRALVNGSVSNRLSSAPADVLSALGIEATDHDRDVVLAAHMGVHSALQTLSSCNMNALIRSMFLDTAQVSNRTTWQRKLAGRSASQQATAIGQRLDSVVSDLLPVSSGSALHRA
jgi:hypothetical protein